MKEEDGEMVHNCTEISWPIFGRACAPIVLGSDHEPFGELRAKSMSSTFSLGNKCPRRPPSTTTSSTPNESNMKIQYMKSDSRKAFHVNLIGMWISLPKRENTKS